jgi:hypothetical protein
MKNLAALQKQFHAAILDPSAHSLQEDFIRKQPPLTAKRRISIYRHAYEVRLLGVLRDDFHILARQLGEKKCTALMRAYIADYPSRSPNLVDLGAHFPEFVKRVARRMQLPKYAAELARFEWALVRAFFAPKIAEDRHGLAQITTAGAEDWVGVKFRFDKSVELFTARWPVDLIHRSKKRILRVQLQKRTILIYRVNGSAYFKELDPGVARVVEQLLRGQALGPASQRMSAKDASALQAHLQEWLQHSVIHSLEWPK